ncbi:hypothetical protein L6164_031108 [Bauhinia variegata]|uniref:Uncharacterized protein n=1 Tax=Bauhinia variegata TaxID=167791 RepID=A0ACB9LES6_BAUVA|nr:hypothetical protein L6164_031108 [Bauhinia variegata]
MNCIQFHSSLLPLHSKLRYQHHQEQTRFLWLSGNEPVKPFPQSQLFLPSPSSAVTKALPHSIVFAAASLPPNSNDMSDFDFLQTCVLLLSVYFIANFIVPEFLSKYFGFDQVNRDQKMDDVTDSNKASTEKKKQKFNSTET